MSLLRPLLSRYIYPTQCKLCFNHQKPLDHLLLLEACAFADRCVVENYRPRLLRLLLQPSRHSHRSISLELQDSAKAQESSETQHYWDLSTLVLGHHSPGYHLLVASHCSPPSPEGTFQIRAKPLWIVITLSTVPNTQHLKVYCPPW